MADEVNLELLKVPSRYLSQINRYVTCILESRLLLEEDLELILQIHDWHVYDTKPKKLSKYTFAFSTACSVMGLSLMAITKRKVFAAFCLVPPSVKALMQVREKYRAACLKRSILSLIDNFKKLSKLNVEIFNYLKTREIVRITTNAELFARLPSESQDILSAVFSQQIVLIGTLMNKIEQLANLLKPHVIYPETWIITDLKLHEFDDYESCLENFSKLRDINILITSKFLSSIAISISPKTWEPSNSRPAEIVFEQIVPKIKSDVDICVKRVENCFNKLRYRSAEIEKHNKQRSTPPRFVVKADQPLLKFLSHMQIAFELGQQIRLQLLKTEKQKNLSALTDSVLQLRNQLDICDQSLDCFCKLYGVMVNQAISQTKTKEQLGGETKEEQSRAEPAMRYDDDVEPNEDEEYNLYIAEDTDDDVDSSMPNNYEEEQSTIYLSAMLQELKNSLKERQALRAARLGLTISEDQEDVNKAKEVDKSTKDTSESKVDNTEQRFALPVLPPPPPPRFSFNVETNASLPKQPSILTSAIKQAATQRGVKEETFGDSFEDSESDENI